MLTGSEAISGPGISQSFSRLFVQRQWVHGAWYPWCWWCRVLRRVYVNFGCLDESKQERWDAIRIARTCGTMNETCWKSFNGYCNQCAMLSF